MYNNITNKFGPKYLENNTANFAMLFIFAAAGL